MHTYSWSYKLLHWIMAVLIFLMFFAFQGFNPEMSQEDRMVMLIGHSSIGTIISMLLIIRLSKRFVLKHAQPQATGNFQKLAKAVHIALYFLMVLVPVTGYLTANFHQLPVQVFGQFTINGEPDKAMFELLRSIHTAAIFSLITLLTLHVSAALFHKFIMRDQTLYKMRPWFNKKA